MLNFGGVGHGKIAREKIPSPSCSPWWGDEVYPGVGSPRRNGLNWRPWKIWKLSRKVASLHRTLSRCGDEYMDIWDDTWGWRWEVCIDLKGIHVSIEDCIQGGSVGWHLWCDGVMMIRSLNHWWMTLPVSENSKWRPFVSKSGLIMVMARARFKNLLDFSVVDDSHSLQHTDQLKISTNQR